MNKLNENMIGLCESNNSCDVRRLVETLRDAIPPEDHPNKINYSYKEVITLFTPCMHPVDTVADYGDTKCICGHAIKYIFAVSYVENTSIQVWPIGSVCINRFYDKTFLCLKTIVDNIDLHKLYNNEYTFADFNKKTGFTKVSADILLRQEIINRYCYNFLLTEIIKRRKGYLNKKQINTMYYIMKFIHEALMAYK